jgi:hypothetical protein
VIKHRVRMVLWGIVFSGQLVAASAPKERRGLQVPCHPVELEQIRQALANSQQHNEFLTGQAVWYSEALVHLRQQAISAENHYVFLRHAHAGLQENYRSLGQAYASLKKEYSICALQPSLADIWGPAATFLNPAVESQTPQFGLSSGQLERNLNGEGTSTHFELDDKAG